MHTQINMTDQEIENLRNSVYLAYRSGFLDGCGAGQRSSLGLTGLERHQQHGNFVAEAERRAAHHRDVICPVTSPFADTPHEAPSPTEESAS